MQDSASSLMSLWQARAENRRQLNTHTFVYFCLIRVELIFVHLFNGDGATGLLRLHPRVGKGDGARALHDVDLGLAASFDALAEFPALNGDQLAIRQLKL